MGWLIAALGTCLAMGGTLAIYAGAPYMQVEWGYSEVIAGTTALSAGILAVALAAILFALRDLKRLAAAGGAMAPVAGGHRIEATRPEPTLALARAPAVSVPDPGRASGLPGNGADHDPSLFPTAASDHAASPDPAPTVVGRYEANGASYVLFSDGTIEVETEAGTQRYASMQDLRADIERQDGSRA